MIGLMGLHPSPADCAGIQILDALPAAPAYQLAAAAVLCDSEALLAGSSEMIGGEEARVRPGHLVWLLLALGSGVGASHCVAQSNFHVELQQNLLIGDHSGEAFGGPLHIAVDSQGRIYVGDWMNRHVRIFSAEGDLEATIGRSGDGPGEFRAIQQVLVGRGDSLYVYDATAFRFTVFAPGEHKPAYTFRLAVENHGVPYRVFVPADPLAGFLVALRHRGSGTVRIHRVNEKGVVAPRTILEGQGSESHARTSTAGGGVTVVRTSPLFGRQAVLGVTPDDEVYYAWSDTIELAFYDLEGNWKRVFRAAAPILPVTQRDIEYALGGASEVRRETLRGAEHHDTKPALHTVLVDDQSWIWTGRYTHDPETLEWWVTAAGGRGHSAVIRLPEPVRLRVVRDGHAYAVSEDEYGAPTVVRFAIVSEGEDGS